MVVSCNDPADLPLARKLFESSLSCLVICPKTPEEYFELLRKSRAVISGRLHTAVVAFSLGIPFLLIDLDGRTSGFLNTYQLDPWSVAPSRGFETALHEKTKKVLDSRPEQWRGAIVKRDQLKETGINLIKEVLNGLVPSSPRIE